MPQILAAIIPAMAAAGGAIFKGRQQKKEAAQLYDRDTTSADELEEAMMEDPTRKPDFGLSKSNNVLFPAQPLKKRTPFMGM